MEQVAGRPSLITTLNQSKISLTPTPPTDPSPPPPPGEGRKGPLPHSARREGGRHLRLSVPRLGGYTRRGGSLCFRPRDRTRPYWGRGRRGRRPTPPSFCLGSQWVEPKGHKPAGWHCTVLGLCPRNTSIRTHRCFSTPPWTVVQPHSGCHVPNHSLYDIAY